MKLFHLEVSICKLPNNPNSFVANFEFRNSFITTRIIPFCKISRLFEIKKKIVVQYRVPPAVFYNSTLILESVVKAVKTLEKLISPFENRNSFSRVLRVWVHLIYVTFFASNDVVILEKIDKPACR